MIASQTTSGWLMRRVAAIVCIASACMGPALAQSPEPLQRPSGAQIRPLEMPVMPQHPTMSPPPAMLKPGVAGNLNQQKLQPVMPGSAPQHPIMESVKQPAQKKPIMESEKEPSSNRPSRPMRQRGPDAEPEKHPVMESKKEPAQSRPAMQAVETPATKKPAIDEVRQPSAIVPGTRPTMPANATRISPQILTVAPLRLPPLLSREAYALSSAGLPSREIQEKNQGAIVNAAALLIARAQSDSCVAACTQAALQCLANVATSAAQKFDAPSASPDNPNIYPQPTDTSAPNANICPTSADMMSPYQYVIDQENQCATTASSCLAQCGGSAAMPDFITEITNDTFWETSSGYDTWR